MQSITDPVVIKQSITNPVVIKQFLTSPAGTISRCCNDQTRRRTAVTVTASGGEQTRTHADLASGPFYSRRQWRQAAAAVPAPLTHH